jgi:pentatricopeptide repeat protein
VRIRQFDLVLRLFDEFAISGIRPDVYMNQIDVYINNNLIHLYGTCGYLNLAQKIFEIMPERSVVSWNAIIDSYVRLAEFDTALKLFGEMLNMFEPDGYTMQGIIY